MPIIFNGNKFDFDDEGTFVEVETIVPTASVQPGNVGEEGVGLFATDPLEDEDVSDGEEDDVSDEDTAHDETGFSNEDETTESDDLAEEDNVGPSFVIRGPRVVDDPVAYILIQGRRQFEREDFRTLRSYDVKLVEYLSHNAWLAQVKSSQLPTVQALAFIKVALEFPPEAKLPPYMKPSGLDLSEYNDFKKEEQVVDITLHNNDAGDVIAEIRRLLGSDIEPGSLKVLLENIIRATLRGEQLERVATLNQVRLVEDVVGVELYNNVARNILGFDDLPSQVDAVLNGDAGEFEGEGQIVTVADTGVDDKHPAFQDRILDQIKVGNCPDTLDFTGHGTHVCGSLLGNGLSNMLASPIRGTAPKAKLITQCLEHPIDENFKVVFQTVYMGSLLQGAYDKGSRVHNNSWGQTWRKGAGQQHYNDHSKAIDEFVSTHPDMVVCFAAGNSGSKRSSTGAHIGAYAAAKNCITVSSCNNRRKTNNRKFTDYHARGKLEGSPDHISYFSSLGPTKELRIKPDVVAPGSMILSAASQPARENSNEEIYGEWPETEWGFMSGTSMATPLVAGCAAVLREQLRGGSAALIKALIINGATDLGLPREQQGFGRVNIAESCRSITNKWIWTSSTRGRPAATNGVKPRSQGRTYASDIVSQPLDEFGNPVPQPTDAWRNKVIHLSGVKDLEFAKRATLKVTLVYTDLPGAVLQINLNLVVRCKIDGKWEAWRGNAKSKGLKHRPDDTNNVEQVTWKDLPLDTVAIVYVGRSESGILGEKKKFAVAWTITPS